METRLFSKSDDSAWQQIRSKVPKDHLLHSPRFCCHYFDDNQAWCRLWGAFEGTELLGVIGIERVDFVAGERKLQLAVGTNYYSFQPGAGILLYHKWVHETGWTLTFGGSDDFHRFAQNAPYAFQVVIPHFVLNRRYRTSGDSGFRRLLKVARNRAGFGRVYLPAVLSAALKREQWDDARVTEVSGFRSAVSCQESTAGLRQAFGVDYLNWRFSASAAGYRQFEVSRDDAHVGNVVLADSRHRLIVAFSQSATNVDSVLSALSAVRYRLSQADSDPKMEVYLACCSSSARRILMEIGFCEASYRRPFVILGAESTPDLSTEIDDWHVDFDIGDNGVRYLQSE